MQHANSNTMPCNDDLTRWERIQAAALEYLADDEADLLTYTAEVQSDRDIFKALTVELMAALHAKTKTEERLRDTVRRQTAIIRDFITAADDRRRA